MQYEKIYSVLIPRLEKELPSYLTYHNVEHTKNVIVAAERLAVAESISGDDLLMLKTAALFHDSGFLQQSDGHEEISCILAREYLPNYEYDDSQIENICRIIMATRLPQTPFDPLSKIICDADLFYLGKDGYQNTAQKLFQEYKHAGIVKTNVEWQLKQIEFLSSHNYFTQSAINLLEPTKQKTLEQLRSGVETSLAIHPENSLTMWVQDALLVLIGVTFAGVALKLFLVPNHFFDGGVTGISLLVHEAYHFNLGLVIVLLNLPLIIISYFSIGKRFAYRTLFSVILLGVALLLIPEGSKEIISDKYLFLIPVFGGVFLGIGIGLIMRTGAALDGIEVLAVYTLRKTSFTITEIILAINIIIFTIAGFMFGVETALLSILTYFCATRCIDYVVEGLQAYTGVTIVSGKSEAIKYQLVNKLGRGITIYKGERGFLPGKYEISSECDIIFTVITRLELRKLKNLVYEVDPQAFVFANTIKEASGGVIKRRHTH